MPLSCPIMRSNAFCASRISSSFRHATGKSRTYASRARPNPQAQPSHSLNSSSESHPSDSIPVKGFSLGIRARRHAIVFGGGIVLGGLYAYFWPSSKTKNAIVIDSPWSTYTLEAKDAVSPTAAIFTLKAKDLSPSVYDNLFRNAIWAVDVQQPQLQIVREYTPLPPALKHDGTYVEEGDTAKLHLLIREEVKGEVSSYLHRLPIGANIEISKPYPQIYLDKEDPDSMVFVVGGTGITTALQAIHALLEAKQDKDKKPAIHVLWANRRREDCLGGISDTAASSSGGSWWSLVPTWLGGSSPQGTVRVEATELGKSPIIDELRRLKDTYKGQLKVDYFVDEEGTFVNGGHISKALADLTPPEGGNGRSFVAISGPDGFMNNLAGEQRSQKNRVSARPTTGVLSELKEQGWQLMVLG